MEIVEVVQIRVKQECQKESNMFGLSAYDHSMSVAKHAKNLAKDYGADTEIVELAAWLHDIASILGDHENHHISGAKFAEQLLSETGLPKPKIKAIKHCIIAHRGSKNIPRQTIEAECLADADAISHFDEVGSLFNLALVIKKLGVSEARAFVTQKLQRCWNKLSARAKAIMKLKYESAMILLGDISASNC